MNPPKNRHFLGLVNKYDEPYWDIFFWGTKSDGLRKSEFVDRALYSMPEIIKWVDLPEIGEIE